MSADIHILPSQAGILLLAVTLKGGEYEQLAHGLHWCLENDAGCEKSQEPNPLFIVNPGVYQLTVTHPEYGEKVVTGIHLSAGITADEVVYLGQINVDDSEENYHLYDERDFNADREHQRRLADRAAEQHFAEITHELRDPHILEPQAGMEEASERVHQQGLQSHPLLGQAAQFDGVAPKLNAHVTENVHAAEAQKDPELRPGAQPKLSRSNTLQFRPGGM